MVAICGFRNSAEIFTMVVNGWKSLPIVMICSILDVGGVSGSTSGKEWNTVLDLKLKFAILSITYLREGGTAQKLKRKLAPIKNQELYFNSTHFFFLEHLSNQKSSWKIRSKQMFADITYFLQETKSSINLQRLLLVKELMHSAWY